MPSVPQRVKMPLSPGAILVWEVFITLLQVLAITSTLIRLAHRWRTGRMWWDDWSAIPPLFCDLIYLVIMWLRATTSPTPTSKAMIVLFSTFLNVFMFRSAVWLSRISLSLGIARIFPPNHPCRRFAFGLGASFLSAYTINTVTSALFAGGPPTTFCSAGDNACTRAQTIYWVGGLLGLIFDCMADVALIVAPLVMLWKIKLPRHQRHLVLALFSSSILSFLASLAFTLSWELSPRLGSDAYFIIRMNANLQAGISLLVCNLLVVTMLFYRIFRRETLPDPDPTSPVSASSNNGMQDDSSPSSQPNSQQQANYYNGSIALTSIYDDSPLGSVSPCTMSESSREGLTAGTFFSEQGTSSSHPPWSFPESRAKMTSII